jgi:hypothetical protein
VDFSTNYVLHTGTYTKIGRLVTFELTVNLATIGSSPRATVQFTGLPFAGVSIGTVFLANSSIGALCWNRKCYWCSCIVACIWGITNELVMHNNWYTSLTYFI